MLELELEEMRGPGFVAEQYEESELGEKDVRVARSQCLKVQSHLDVRTRSRTAP